MHRFKFESLDQQIDRMDSENSDPDQLLLILPDGTVIGGWDAVCALLRHHPRLSWLGHIGAWPILRTLGQAAYRWFARHRHRLSRRLRDT